LQIPISSGSPELEKLIEKKHRIVVFNKADLADPSSQTVHSLAHEITIYFSSQWVLDHLKQKGLKGVYISAHKNSVNEMKKLIPLILEESGKMKKTQENNVMIVGIPNVGKSTIINAIRITTKKGGRVAKTGAVPGVTRGVTGFRLTDPSTTSSSTYILDTPGAMSPKFEKDDNDRAIKYAATGTCCFCSSLSFINLSNRIKDIVVIHILDSSSLSFINQLKSNTLWILLHYF
jgi:ribosome biogenesis GTPase A